MKRIGLLTSGGDCQALNATMRGIVKTVLLGSDEPVEIYGFQDGYRGLIDSNFRMLGWSDFSGILTRGGTILGTSRVPFKTIDEVDEDGVSKASSSSTACACWAATDRPRPPTASPTRAST